MKNRTGKKIAAVLTSLLLLLAALPFAAFFGYAEEGEVIEVRGADELKAALNRNTPVAEIKIVQDLTLEEECVILYDAAHIDNYHDTVMTVMSGVTLRLTSGGAVGSFWPSYEGDWETGPLPNGRFINNGRIEVEDGGMIQADFAENNGEVLVRDGGDIICPTLNNGTVEVENGGYCGTTQGSRAVNNGNIVIRDGGILESRFGTTIENGESGRLTLDGDFYCGCADFDEGVMWFENRGTVEGRGSVNLYTDFSTMSNEMMDALIEEMMAALGQETRFEDWGDISIYKIVIVWDYEGLAAALPGNRVVAGEPVEGDMDVKVYVYDDVVVPTGGEVCAMAEVHIAEGVKVEIEEGGTLECSIENEGEIVVHSGGRLYTTMGGEIRNGGTVTVEPGAAVRSQMGSPFFNLDNGVFNLDGIFYCGCLNMDNFDVCWFENFGQMTGTGEVALYEAAPDWMPVSDMEEVVGRVEGKIGEGENKPTVHVHTVHSFGDWIYVPESEFDDAYEMRSCADCGLTESRYVAAVTYGDVNGDGSVNKKDSLALKKYLADNSYAIDTEAADVVHDGTVNKKDSLRLKQYLAGWDVQLGA